MLQNALHTAQSLNHVRAVIVQVPEFAVMSLVGPPERILLQHLYSDKTNPKSILTIICAKTEY